MEAEYTITITHDQIIDSLRLLRYAFMDDLADCILNQLVRKKMTNNRLSFTDAAIAVDEDLS